MNQSNMTHSESYKHTQGQIYLQASQA